MLETCRPDVCENNVHKVRVHDFASLTIMWLFSVKLTRERSTFRAAVVLMFTACNFFFV